MGEAKARGTFQERRAHARGELLGVKLTTYDGNAEPINLFVHSAVGAGPFRTLDREAAKLEAATWHARNPKGEYVVEAFPKAKRFPKGKKRSELKVLTGRRAMTPEGKDENGKNTGKATRGAKWDLDNRRARAKIIPHRELIGKLKLRPFKDKGPKRNTARRMKKARAGWPVVLRKADLRPGCVWLRKAELAAIKRVREASGGSKATLAARLASNWLARARAVALGLPAYRRMAMPWRLRRRAALAARKAEKLKKLNPVPTAFNAEDLVTIKVEATTAP